MRTVPFANILIIIAIPLGLLLGAGACTEDPVSGGEPADPEAAARAAFEKARAFIFEGNFDAVWDLLGESVKDDWAKGVHRQQQGAANAAGDREAMEQMMQVQYGVSLDRFLRMSPRQLYAANLSRRREETRQLTIMGSKALSDDRVRLEVQYGNDPAVTLWEYARTPRGWLLDKVPGPPGQR